MSIGMMSIHLLDALSMYVCMYVCMLMQDEQMCSRGGGGTTAASLVKSNCNVPAVPPPIPMVINNNSTPGTTSCGMSNNSRSRRLNQMWGEIGDQQYHTSCDGYNNNNNNNMPPPADDHHSPCRDHGEDRLLDPLVSSWSTDHRRPHPPHHHHADETS